MTEMKEIISSEADLEEKGWGDILSGIWALGPNCVGPNVLLNCINEGSEGFKNFRGCVRESSKTSFSENYDVKQVNEYNVLENEVANGIESGFELAMRAGPFCEEQLWGIAVVIESIKVVENSISNNASNDGDTDGVGRSEAIMTEPHISSGPLAGQVMSAVKEGIRSILYAHKKPESDYQIRLCEGIFMCQIQCHVDQHSGETLGKLYSVISKRRGKIRKEDLWEGTSIFTIDAHIPVVECFGLADDLRKQTSGAASTPQLIFSHWEILDENPFFKATTVDELEEFGESGYDESYLKNNIARKYMMQVRKRKGLDSGEKIVVHAEKQRTLTKMK
eukprot:CAMPEP_0184043944 /NCGR_PEP_ID=MMETSP0955-20130417/67196_1 /TAXON_ID=627963 /ORGANISM="Aplanochytrium sp, Strain PBS07" /LENGTH=334 /DNA_ID=CAMNT_0026334897 /DNA_START=12 /DNA_END=1016 /DNA_ORIENTATION=-